MMLLLDLDDTLTDAAPGFRSWAQEWVSRFEESRRPEMVDFLVQPEMQSVYPRERLALFREHFALRDSVEDLHADYVADAAAHTRLVDGALDLLGRARDDGWRLGIVTNGPGDLQRAKLDHLRLLPHVDGVVISGEAGVAKPDPGIFALARDRVGHTNGPGWMVGDNPVADIGGAHASGLRSVWLRHGRSWDHEHGAPDLQADSLAEAVELISRETARAVTP